jgi:hypothetical protein
MKTTMKALKRKRRIRLPTWSRRNDKRWPRAPAINAGKKLLQMEKKLQVKEVGESEK